MSQGDRKGLLKTSPRCSRHHSITARHLRGGRVGPDLIDRHFTGPRHYRRDRPRGIARETLTRHLRAYPEASEAAPGRPDLPLRRDGEQHQWNPQRSPSAAAVRPAVARLLRWAAYMNMPTTLRASLRGLSARFADAPVALYEVEPASEIVSASHRGDVARSLSRERRYARDRDEPVGGSPTREAGRTPRATCRSHGDRAALDQAVASALRRDGALLSTPIDPIRGPGSKRPARAALPATRRRYSVSIRARSRFAYLTAPHHDIYSRYPSS